MKKTEHHEEDQNGEKGTDLFIDNGELYFGIDVENTSEQRIRDFMAHANDLERLRLAQQLEALRDR